MNSKYTIVGNTIIVTNEKGSNENIPYNKYAKLKLVLENIIENTEKELKYLEERFLLDKYIRLALKIVAGTILISFSCNFFCYLILNTVASSSNLSFLLSTLYVSFSSIMGSKNIEKEKEKRIIRIKKLLKIYDEELNEINNLYINSIDNSKAEKEEYGTYIYDEKILDKGIYQYHDVSNYKPFVKKKVKKT